MNHENIANYRDIINNASEIIRTIDNDNKEAISAFKQINGYAVVVEQVSNAKNELMLKTMYKVRGNYKNSLIYKKTLAKYQNSN
ncbi:hypothetical protein HpHNI24_06700 [Helicobacter pylori]